MPTVSNVTATTAPTSNIISATTTNVVDTTQLAKVTASTSIKSANTNDGSAITTSVNPTGTTQLALLSSVTSTSVIVSNTENLNFSTTIRAPTIMSTSGVLSNTTSNISLVNNATSTLRTTLVPTISSIMTTSSTTAISNLSTTIQTYSSTNLTTTALTSAPGFSSGDNPIKAITSIGANIPPLSTNGIASSFVNSITTSSSNDTTTSRLNGVSTSGAASNASTSVPPAINATTTLKIAMQTTASAATTSGIYTSTATVTLQSTNGTGLPTNASSPTSAYNISNFITSTRTTEWPVLSSNISTASITSNVVRTTSIISEMTSNRLGTTAVGTSASGMFPNSTANSPSANNTSAVPMLSTLTAAAASSNITVLKTNTTSITTTIQSNSFTTKSYSDTSPTTVSNLTTTDFNVTSSIRTTGFLTVTVGSTSGLVSNSSSVTTTIGNTSNTLIPNVTGSNATPFTMLSSPTSIPGIMSTLMSISPITPSATVKPTGVSALPTTSTLYAYNPANIMQTSVSTSTSEKTPETYSNPMTIAVNVTSGISVTRPSTSNSNAITNNTSESTRLQTTSSTSTITSNNILTSNASVRTIGQPSVSTILTTSGGGSNANSLQTSLVFNGTNSSNLSVIPTTGIKTSPSPSITSNVLVFNATMSLRPSGGLPADITTAVTTPNISNPKINESIQTTRSSVFSSSLSTADIIYNSVKSLPTLSMESTNSATVLPIQSIISAGIVSNASNSPSTTSMVNMTTSPRLSDVASVNIRTSTITTQSSISGLLTTLGSKDYISTNFTNRTTGVTVPSAAISTAELMFSTNNRIQSSANTSAVTLLSQGVSSSTAVLTVQRIAADPLMPLNKSSDPLQVTSAISLSGMTTSRPTNVSMNPMDNGTHTSYPLPLSQSIQVSSSMTNTKGPATSSVWDSANTFLQNSLSTGASASYTTTGNMSATSTITVHPTIGNSAKRKNLISMLWSLIFPALANIKSSYQAASKLNDTTETAVFGQLKMKNKTGMTDLGNDIEIVHVSYWKIKAGGEGIESQSIGQLHEDDTQDTDVMEILKALKDNNFS
ncbi:uncharacterized protein LOC142760920 [Rhinoderma darwinii]|uniref:uncharacterized protein LOC142760920 n=1 Tax=Rhinoderma darwinii TaxID=43563 RepID=UPI003F674449